LYQVFGIATKKMLYRLFMNRVFKRMIFSPKNVIAGRWRSSSKQNTSCRSGMAIF